MRRKITLLLFLCFCSSHFAFAQQHPAEADSAKLYRDIEAFSKKRKSTSFIYRIFFRPVDIPQTEQSKKKKQVFVQKPYSAYEGKIIRNIDIVTLDPFGYSITDTSVKAQNDLFKAGNTLHVKSQRITIRNLILIKKNKPFDSLLVKESERLIRSQKFVHDVTITVVPAGKKSDSVDIFIRELDNWSIQAAAGISPVADRFNLNDKNFLGFGHEFQNSYSRDFVHGINSFNTNYNIPSIRNTYISSTLHYGIDGYGNYNKSISVNRPFFSPFAQWAAGVSLYTQLRKDSLKDINNVNVEFNLKSNTQDYWAGKSTRFIKGNSEDARVTNLIWAGRYYRVHYFEKPSEIYDTLHLYAEEYFYLAGIGIATRKYVKDKYVFNYGVTEDVPVGTAYGLTGGYQIRNNIGRVYLGARYSFGNYYDWGYLSSTFEYGTFYRASHAEQGVFTTGINYFTDLFGIGNWKFRQFLKPQFTWGINRQPYENITINNENGIRGFNSISLTGTQKLVVTLQTQSYSPLHFLGFRFGPYLIYSLGMLGTNASGFKRSQVFSEFGVGVLIKNEYLVLNYFQISASFYPIIPGQGENIFKYNPTRTTDFGLRDFSIGEPSIVGYQ